jgi:Icc-related predicted phosphoesterase
MTKIIAISDTHGDHELLEIPNGDIFIHCGDFCKYGKQKEVDSFAKWVNSLPHKYKIVIGGNHDWRMRDTYPKVFSQINYLNNESITLEGIKFWGSPYTPIVHYDKPWVYYRGTGHEVWDKMPDQVDVLITHGPPNGILDGAIREYIGDGNYRYENVGCDELLYRILKVKPNYHLFGHIHEQGGKSVKRYGIEFHNCSVLNEGFGMEHKAREIII